MMWIFNLYLVVFFFHSLYTNDVYEVHEAKKNEKNSLGFDSYHFHFIFRISYVNDKLMLIFLFLSVYFFFFFFWIGHYGWWKILWQTFFLDRIPYIESLFLTWNSLFFYLSHFISFILFTLGQIFRSSNHVVYVWFDLVHSCVWSTYTHTMIAEQAKKNK